jgi:hypothetical protein
MLDTKGIVGLDFHIDIILYVMTMNESYLSDLSDGVPSTMRKAHMRTNPAIRITRLLRESRTRITKYRQLPNPTPLMIRSAPPYHPTRPLRKSERGWYRNREERRGPVPQAPTCSAFR